MALEFEWGSCQTVPDLTGVVAILNILQKCWLDLTGVVAFLNILQKIG
jgi:hypothetical protein